MTQTGLSGSDRVDPLMGRKYDRAPLLLVPIAINDPLARGPGARIIGDALRELFAAGDIAQLDAGQSLTAPEEVNMRIVETGDDAAASQIQHLCPGAGKLR